MIIEYSPEGADRKSWDLKQVKVLAAEAETVERLTEWTWGETLQRLSKGSTIALRAIVFVLAKRDEPALKYGQFNPPASELDYWLDAEERNAYREAIADAEISEAERERMLEALDELDAEMVKRGLEVEPGAVPKGSAVGASPTAA